MEDEFIEEFYQNCLQSLEIYEEYAHVIFESFDSVPRLDY